MDRRLVEAEDAVLDAVFSLKGWSSPEDGIYVAAAIGRAKNEGMSHDRARHAFYRLVHRGVLVRVSTGLYRTQYQTRNEVPNENPRS